MKKSPAQKERFFIREVEADDLEAIFDLSALLNSVNFPHDRNVLEALVHKAQASFDGTIEDPSRRQYMFVIAGTKTGKVIGTSTVLARHGHREAPHVYFDVLSDERYSSTLDRHFSHTTLRLGFSYRGPTEIGALILSPDYRAAGLGRLLSLVRFLFIGMYRSRFENTVIAELMPPLLPDGRSELWEYLGQRFTGLTYQEADKLSHTNKEFIYALFPQTAIYASTLPIHVADLIGQVGEQTKGAQRILEKIGFKYSNQIDPFDGGPHFSAATDQISLIKNLERRVISKIPLAAALEDALLVNQFRPAGLDICIVGAGQTAGASQFRAIVAATRILSDGSVEVSKDVQNQLSLSPGDPIWLAPFK